MTPLASDYPLPNLEQLEQEMPEPFRIAGAIAHVDMSAARQLRNVDEELGVLVEVINQQSFKINMLLSYLLSQLDDPVCRHHTQSVGGSQLSFISSLPLQPGQLLRLKLFLQEEAAAIYCYGQVSEIESQPTGLLVHAIMSLFGRQTGRRWYAPVCIFSHVSSSFGLSKEPLNQSNLS